MLDYRELPPEDTEQLDEPINSDNPATCSSCEKDLSYTYRVEIPSICSHCLQLGKYPYGTLVHRNTTVMSEFAKESPPGFYWDFFAQAHAPKQPVKPSPPTMSFETHTHEYHPQFDPHVHPSEGYHWSESLQAYIPDNKVPSGGGGGGGGGFIREPVVYESHTPSRRPGSSDSGPQYAYDPAKPTPRKPTIGDHPNDVYRYIIKNYSPQEVRERYHEIREEVLYAPNPAIVLHPERVNDLTDRVASAILEDCKTETKEENVDAGHALLSRSEAEAAYKRAAAALAEIENLEQKYSVDLPNGSVVAFRLRFSGTTNYSYAAIKASGQWFTTGKVHGAHPAGVGVDWSVLLECFEKFGASEFEVLRTGGETPELPQGVVTRNVQASPDAPMTAFQEQNQAQDPQTVKGSVVYDSDEEEDIDND